jgi:hypothetical protein
MRPNTPHAVFTPQHSIVMGGHFYSISNLQDTFHCIVHCFIGNKILTNTEHCRTRILLIRMMHYVYKCMVTSAKQDGKP